MIKQNISRNLRNITGWRTKRRIVVFESDDWGSIRMPSMDSFTRLKKLGVDLESFDYAIWNLNDTLASRKDLELLFELLASHNDKNYNPCIFTAITAVANPDFTKIRNNGFLKYFYEPFTETLKKYYPNENVFGIWKEGLDKKVFFPQFHGREHLNVSAWLKALRAGQKNASLAFDECLWCYVPDNKDKLKITNQAAFQLTDMADLSEHKKILTEGLDLFRTLFGYHARYFVPPNGVINNTLNNTISKKGIEIRSTSKIQYESTGPGKTRKVIHWLGQKDVSGIRYIIRNCVFEPSDPCKDWVDSCLADIQTAFRWNKPAIISSHRVNYIGTHNTNNRDNSLLKLQILLKSIKQKWPDIEFMSTDKLGTIMQESKK
ncbi:MAG: hypothetical protein JXK95_14050 [Bacteroidales bacterium]|nr:hypothetical protein [Bacteroidales bacterium]